jgi:PEP-CTERM motif-containing protein
MLDRFTVLSLVVAIALILVSPVVNADTVQVTLTGVSGGSQYGVDTSPCYGTVGTQTNVPIFCDDYWHEVYMGETWRATVNTFATLNQARFQGANAAATLLMYDEAAFLVNQLASNPQSSADISFAIWSIFSSNVPDTANSAWWVNYARNQTFTPGEFANFEVLTPIDCSVASAQEYLVSTPEPATLMMLTSGLFALGTWRRRTNRSAQVS